MQRNPSVTSAFQTYFENVLKQNHNNPALISRWGAEPARFETQIMCKKMGTPIPDSQKWTCDGETFGPQRWPYDSDTEPNYSDPPIQYNIGERLLAIGTSWWDWKNKRSIGLGFDFDSLIDHDEGVGVDQSTIAKLDRLDLPWVEVIRSTRGNGRHIYIWFDPDNAPIANNHLEHAAIARSFLPLLATHSGLDIDTSVDCKGLIMWIHHVNATKENRGYELVKPATQILTADHVPPNWKDHLEVVSGSRTKVRVQGWTPNGTTSGDELDEMTQAYSRTELDEVHLKILEELEGTGHTSVWVHDHHLWQGHTGALKQVYDDFAERGTPLRGLFDTNSSDTDPGKPNCFARPKPGGAWDVYRFGEGTAEHPLWDQQGKWTHIGFNTQPTLKQVCLASGGYEGPDQRKGFLFDSKDDFLAALELLGSKVKLPKKADGRELSLRMIDGRIVATVEKKRGDEKEDFPRWVKGSGVWERLIDDADETADTEMEEETLWSELDGKFRALRVAGVCGGQFHSWVIYDNTESWTTHPRENIKSYLASIGYKQADGLLGGAIYKCWTLVNEPFGPEYPGGRMWNRDAPQFVYPPVDLKEGEEPKHPTWNRLLEHCGVELNEYIPELKWCKDWGITTGGDYLLAWIACMFQNPWCKLPYLFMYGPQNSGKSSFHEAIGFLLTKGVEKADRALTSKQGYNGELEGAILAVVDEVDITKAGSEVYNKLKEWVTAGTISIHAKYKQVVDMPSTLHFVQMSNDRRSLPVFPGDTRITAMNVPFLEAEIPRDEFHRRLKEEASHFMRSVVDYHMPPPIGRLALPIIETQGKIDAADANTDDLELFLEEKCFPVPGAFIKITDFMEKLHAYLPEHLISDYPRRVVEPRLKERYVVGMGSGKNNQVLIGNLSFNPNAKPSTPYTREGAKVRKEEL